MDFEDKTLLEGKYEEEGEVVEGLFVVEGTAPGRATGSRYIQDRNLPDMKGTVYPEQKQGVEADVTAEKRLLEGGDNQNYRLWHVEGLEDSDSGQENKNNGGLPENTDTGLPDTTPDDEDVPGINDTIDGKPEEPNNDGGDNEMTEDYDWKELDATHAIAYEGHQNTEEYDDIVEGDVSDLGVHGEVALGGAAVIKGIEEGEYENLEMRDVGEFFEEYDKPLDETNFALQKGALGGDQYDIDIPELVEDEVEAATGQGVYAVIFEGLYREKAEDNRESQEVIDGILDAVSGLDTSTPSTASFRDALDDAEEIERRQRDMAERINQKARNL